MRVQVLALLFFSQTAVFSQNDIKFCGSGDKTSIRVHEDSELRFTKSLRSTQNRYLLHQDRAEIQIEYIDFPQKARLAFQRAADIWSAYLTSKIPIRIRASFAELDTFSLGAGQPYSFYLRNQGFDVYFPVSLLNQHAQSDLEPGNPHIEVKFSNRTKFYFGLDGNPGKNQHDFLTVALHEITHGLGFFDSFDFVDESSGNPRGSYGFGEGKDPAIFDVFVFDHYGSQVLPARLVKSLGYDNPSRELYAALTGIKLFWRGIKTLDNGLYPFMLWAHPENHGVSVFPITGLPSISHLDDDAYAPGTVNSLMTPTFESGKAIHDPGPIVLGMMADMGWKIRDKILQIPHFASGSGVNSDLIVTNLSTKTAQISLEVLSPTGEDLDGDFLFGGSQFTVPPFGSRTLSTNENNDYTGSLTVSSDVPVSALIRFHVTGIGTAGVNSSPKFRRAIVPVRRIGRLSTGVAVRNTEMSEQTVGFILKDESGNTVSGGRYSQSIPGRGRIAAFIEQLFPNAETSEFKGELSIEAQGGFVAGMALEFNYDGGFTTLPVSSYP